MVTFFNEDAAVTIKGLELKNILCVMEANIFLIT